MEYGFKILYGFTSKRNHFGTIFLLKPFRIRFRHHDQCARPIDHFELRIDD